MNIRPGLMALAALAAWPGWGQDLAITSFPGNGTVAWTNAVNTNAFYRVEWAAQAGGPWYRSFDNIKSLDGHGATGLAVAVPMFYRVMRVTNEPPQGMAWIEGGDFEMVSISEQADHRIRSDVST